MSDPQQPKKPSTVIQTCNSKAGRSEVLSHTQSHNGFEASLGCMRHLLKKKKKRKEAILTSISLGFSILNIRKHGLCSFVTVTHSQQPMKSLLCFFLSFSLFSLLLPCLAHLICCVYSLAACGQIWWHITLFNSKWFGSNTIEWVQTVFSAWLNVSMYIIP